MNRDYILYAKYRAIKNRQGKITDLDICFANGRIAAMLGYDPTDRRRSECMEENAKMCSLVQNVLDFGIAKHYAYSSRIFGYLEEIIEPDLSTPDCVNVYSIDIKQLHQDDNEQSIRNNVSTILSMFNVTLIHWNIKEHYIYSDTVLTVNFNEDNADLYVGNNVRSSYDLYKMVDTNQRAMIEEMVGDLREGRSDFLSFDMVIRNSVGDDTLVKVNIIPENRTNMYLIGIQF